MGYRLVLFDIDGTLVRPTGIGRISLERAFEERFGVTDVFEGVTFHGRTDPDIFAQGLRRVGGDEDVLPELLSRYLELLGDELRDGADLLLPGVLEVLEALLAEDECVVGLVTGNVREGARLKLARDGVFERFHVGAFGGEAADRTGLVRLAVSRARQRMGRDPGGSRSFHVGDTTNDVVAARDGGVRSVAVATGGEDLDTLRAASPDHLFPALEPAAGFLEVVLQ